MPCHPNHGTHDGRNDTNGNDNRSDMVNKPIQRSPPFLTNAAETLHNYEYYSANDIIMQYRTSLFYYRRIHEANRDSATQVTICPYRTNLIKLYWFFFINMV